MVINIFVALGSNENKNYTPTQICFRILCKTLLKNENEDLDTAE